MCHVASKLFEAKTKCSVWFGLGVRSDQLSECRQLGESVEGLTLSVTDEVPSEASRCRIAPAPNGKELASTITLLRAN